MQKQRLEFPDSIKGLAVLLMIQVHLIELFAKQEIYSGTVGSVALFLGGIPAAPIFMVMMGYFLAFGKKDTRTMFLRGIRLFFGGILLNTGLNAHLLFNIFVKGWNFDPWQYILGGDILPLAGLSLMSLSVFIWIFKERFWAYFLAAFAISLGSQFTDPQQFEYHQLKYIFTFLIGGTSWSYFPLIPWLSFPLVGYGFHLSSKHFQLEEISKSIWFYIVLGIILIALGVSFAFGFQTSIDLPVYYHHNLNYFIWSLGFMILWVFGLYLLHKILNKSVFFIYLRFLGKHVTLIYVFQWLIIGNIATAIYKTQDLGETIFWFLNISIISSGLTYLWLRIRAKSSK